MRLFHLLLAAGLLAGCSAASDSDFIPHDNWPSKADLVDNFRAQDTSIIVYAKEDHALADLFFNGMAALQQEDDRFKVLLRRDDEITEYEVQHYPLYVIGTYEHLLIRRLSGNIPARFAAGSFEFNDKVYNMPNDLVKISFYPNVFNPKMPLSVIFGNHEEVIVEYVQNELQGEWGYFFWDNWGYQVYHNGKRSIVGNFSEAADTRWDITNVQHWEFDYTGEEVLKSAHARYFAHSGAQPATLTAYAEHVQADLNRVQAFCGNTLSDPTQVHIYPSPEIQSMMLNAADQSVIIESENSVHTVIDKEFAGRYDEKINMLALRQLLGKPSNRAIEEGLAVNFTAEWQQVHVPSIAFNLLSADALPALSLLLNDEAFEGESDFLMHVAAASLVSFLLETKGESYVKDLYTGKQPAGSILSLQSAWHTYIRQTMASTSMLKTEKAVLPDMLKGFNFAHEGYQVYNGYMGSEADKSLDKLKELGVNTIAIIPYSLFRSMDKPMRYRYTEGAGAENDVAVIHAAYEAKERGMTTMLKPQLWSWLGWTGDITMQNEADWKAFFEYYEEWIMHYALLAEIYDMDILCVGNEFAAASLSQHAAWDDIFEKVRTVYSGHITYAANWGDEFEQVDFWDKLDFISVNNYYPLSAKSDPTDAELLAGFEANLDKIEQVSRRYNKPVVMTEIGFKSIAQPWLNPHKDADEQDYSEEAQKRCYTIMQQAVADEQWLRGVYLWKWPSYMGYAEDYKKDFNPCGKQAEQVVKAWFSK